MPYDFDPVDKPQPCCLNYANLDPILFYKELDSNHSAGIIAFKCSMCHRTIHTIIHKATDAKRLYVIPDETFVVGRQLNNEWNAQFINELITSDNYDNVKQLVDNDIFPINEEGKFIEIDLNTLSKTKNETTSNVIINNTDTNKNEQGSNDIYTDINDILMAERDENNELYFNVENRIRICVETIDIDDRFEVNTKFYKNYDVKEDTPNILKFIKNNFSLFKDTVMCLSDEVLNFSVDDFIEQVGGISVIDNFVENYVLFNNIKPVKMDDDTLIKYFAAILKYASVKFPLFITIFNTRYERSEDVKNEHRQFMLADYKKPYNNTIEVTGHAADEEFTFSEDKINSIEASNASISTTETNITSMNEEPKKLHQFFANIKKLYSSDDQILKEKFMIDYFNSYIALYPMVFIDTVFHSNIFYDNKFRQFLDVVYKLKFDSLTTYYNFVNEMLSVVIEDKDYISIIKNDINEYIINHRITITIDTRAVVDTNPLVSSTINTILENTKVNGMNITDMLNTMRQSAVNRSDVIDFYCEKYNIDNSLKNTSKEKIDSVITQCDISNTQLVINKDYNCCYAYMCYNVLFDKVFYEKCVIFVCFRDDDANATVKFKDVLL